ncbi:MAG: DUF502 domain-containing protein [Pirellulaceae bacterium]|nr:DUF502 domain-containing protein [Pirellulaceae bacterium]
MTSRSKKSVSVSRGRPFRRSVLRGLAVVLPPLLTIVILLWILNTVQDYVLTPIEIAAKHAITWANDETLTVVPASAKLVGGKDRSSEFIYEGQQFISIGDKQWIPLSIYQRVRQDPGLAMPETSEGYYHRFIELTYLKRSVVLPVFICCFVLLLYFLGRFLAYGMGRFMYNAMELIINQLPIIRTVYTSVKKVTDFVFSENEMEFNRVVAVEYPRKGLWSLGFVTGEGMRCIAEEAGEPVLSVLMPTSPMPATGFTITVRKSEAVDLDITIDQAFQFIVSCGVVVPISQQHHQIGENVQASIDQHLSATDLERPQMDELS